MGVGGLSRQKSFGRKFNEMIIATQINHNYTKQEILEMYLNQVNYGSGAYGVEAAAEVYFNKHAKQLDLAQCALIAGLPNRPADFNPYKSKTPPKPSGSGCWTKCWTRSISRPLSTAGGRRADPAGAGQSALAGQPDFPCSVFRQLCRGPASP